MRRIFQFLKGYCNKTSDPLFSVSSGGGQEVICLICSKEDLHYTPETFATARIVKLWKRLTGELTSLKNRFGWCVRDRICMDLKFQVR